jgi:hypothetical protein
MDSGSLYGRYTVEELLRAFKHSNPDAAGYGHVQELILRSGNEHSLGPRATHTKAHTPRG